MKHSISPTSIRHILAGFIVLLTLAGCGRLIVGKNPANTPEINFDHFVKTVGENYAFFSEKKVDWAALEQQYRPLVNNRMGNDSLYLIFSEMLASLRDGHVNFYIDFDRSRSHEFIFDYPANIDKELIARNYWGKDYLVAGGFVHNWLRDSVGYIHYDTFGGKGFSGRQMNYMLNRYTNGRGLILDLRGNGGGSMGRMYAIVRRFIPDTTYLGTTQLKNGPGPNDFTPLDSIYLKPAVDYAARAKAKAKALEKKKGKEEKTKKVDDPPAEKQEATAKNTKRKPNSWAVADSTGTWLRKPVVVLVGRRTYSAANFCSAYLSTLPNVTLIGDRTGGGGGVPVSFELPNGWKLRLSATRTYLPDGTDIENGIEPDIYQATGYEEAINGKDAIIERAIDLLSSK